jgi:hypothetical protein
MPRRNPAWPAVLEALQAAERVATHEQLRSWGLSNGALYPRIGPTGPWQRLLPGVVLAHRGTPTHRELLLGAIAFAGPTAVVSGVDALRASGVRGLERRPVILVLVNADHQRQSFGFVRVERTTRLPDPLVRQGIRYAPPARALIDLCRHQEALTDVRALVATVVQQRLCSVRELASEIRAAPRQRTASTALALAEVADGVRSLAEARAREILRRSGLPAPEWNARLVDADGVPFLQPDAWWPEQRAALEIDSRKWHLSPEDWARTQRRQRLLTAHGVMVMSFSPTEIMGDPDGFIREVGALLRAATMR